MEKFTLHEVARAVSGELRNADGRREVLSVIIDSRVIEESCLFVAIKGDVFDGHKFADEALESGAICILSHKNLGKRPHIKVKNTKAALLDLAKWYLELFNIPVVAVTGSAGKTTTKDMIAAVLSKKLTLIKTKGNFNNEIGLPLTVFKVSRATEVAVLEMGMNNFGEIHKLSKLATPEVCVITNIGDAHIGNLGSREGILKAKSEIFDFADENAVAVLNADDVLLNKISPNVSKILYYGKEKTAYCSFEKIEDLGLNGTVWKFSAGVDKFTLKIPLPGDYLAYNAAAAITVGRYFGVNKHDIIEAFEFFRPAKNRINIFEISGVTVVDDVYNANPPSMKAMIDSILKAPGRKICVFGDMLELGDNSASYHEDVGRYAGEVNIDLLFLQGDFCKDYERGFLQSSKKETVASFGKLEQLIEKLKEQLIPGDTVLVKASRGMRFERIIEELKRC